MDRDVFRDPIDGDEGTHFASAPAQVVRHCQRDDSTDAISAQQYASFRLEAHQRFHIVVGERFDGLAEVAGLDLLGRCLYSVKPDVRVHLSGEIQEVGARRARHGVDTVECGYAAIGERGAIIHRDDDVGIA